MYASSKGYQGFWSSTGSSKPSGGAKKARRPATTPIGRASAWTIMEWLSQHSSMRRADHSGFPCRRGLLIEGNIVVVGASGSGLASVSKKPGASQRGAAHGSASQRQNRADYRREPRHRPRQRQSL